MDFIRNQFAKLKKTTTLQQRIILSGIGACYVLTAVLAVTFFMV